MKKAIYLSLIFFLFTAIFNDFAFAHVPYLEEQDLTEAHPFQVTKSVEQSIAVYSWLQFEDQTFFSTDIDPYAFSLTDSSEVYIQVLVPACRGYETFAPWFALVGPGLPDPTEEYPFEIPAGDGVLVTSGEPTYPREIFYEPFGNQDYFQGPTFDQTISTPGDYRIYYWDPDQKGGDYVAVIGDKEIWEFDDIIRALIETPKIRRGEELHLVCEPPVDVDDDSSGDDTDVDDTIADDDTINLPADDDAADDTMPSEPDKTDGDDDDNSANCGC